MGAGLAGAVGRNGGPHRKGRLLQFLHPVAGAGLIGAMAAIAVIRLWAPGAPRTVPILIAASRIAAWVKAATGIPPR